MRFLKKSCIFQAFETYPHYERPLQLLQHYNLYIYVYAQLSFFMTNKSVDNKNLFIFERMTNYENHL